jgi:hypothetical protein
LAGDSAAPPSPGHINFLEAQGYKVERKEKPKAEGKLPFGVPILNSARAGAPKRRTFSTRKSWEGARSHVEANLNPNAT